MGSHHDPTLVLLSFVIAVLASYTTLDLTNSLVLTRGRAQLAWLAAGALAMGTGIWAMHFTGMLAFHLEGRQISYELKLLTASIAIAIAASMLALFIFTRSTLTRRTLFIAGLAMGAAISGMHYTGMAALRASATILWNPWLVATSIGIAVAAAFVALNLAGRVRASDEHPALLKLAGAGIMGIAIAGMHYTAMWAATFVPGPPDTAGETLLLATGPLAIAVTISSIIILAVAIGASVTTRSLARRAEVTRREQEFAEQIRQSEEYYRSLIENATDLIVVVDASGHRRYASPSYRRILGYDPTTLIGRKTDELMHPDDVADFHATFAALLSETGTEREFSVRVRHADGSWRTLHVVAHNLLQHPAVRGVIMTAQDETERRRLEMQFQQSQKMEAVGRLAGGVAHDFNNLLTVIMGNTAMLLSDEHSEATRGVLLEVRDAAQRAAGLTRQLLAFSRQQVLQPRVLQLNDIVVGMNNMIMRLLGEDIEVQLRLSEASPPIRADAGQLEQALLNLAVNARDAMPHGGLLTLATGPMTTDRVLASQHDQVPPGNYACLEVSDTGHGIDPSVMPRVFEPFFTTKDVSKGTGLGLATVYGIMKQSGGYVTVRSAPERGSNFRLLFPALQDQEVPHLSEDSSNGEAQGSATILLIEDEMAVRSFAKRALEQRGYRVIAAASGLEAIEHAREYHGQIHLIVSDVVLPDINGREASDRICQVRAATRVLFMSGYTEDEMIHRGVRSNGLNFLQKPFGPAELIDKVRKILGH